MTCIQTEADFPYTFLFHSNPKRIMPYRIVPFRVYRALQRVMESDPRGVFLIFGYVDKVSSQHPPTAKPNFRAFK